jgi:hypothetical protein
MSNLELYALFVVVAWSDVSMAVASVKGCDKLRGWDRILLTLLRYLLSFILGGSFLLGYKILLWLFGLIN